ncbi:MAG: EAL domain-containing protein [Betaproteobacteria bacterium]
MPLSDFVRYINAQHPVSFSGSPSASSFVSEEGKVSAYYAGLRLESVFLEVLDAVTGELQGHAASLVVSRAETNMPLQPEVLYAQPRNDAEFIYLDRLVRTLHTLNHLTSIAPRSRGTLLLGVHPRHVASVAADHGLAFEEILQSCGLFPQQITLEFEIDNQADTGFLVKAFGNYKSRGYGIAVSSLRANSAELAVLKEIQPAIVKLDPRLLSSANDLKEYVDALHDLGAQVMIEGLNSALLRRTARENGIDLLQVFEPLRRLIHAQTLHPVAIPEPEQQVSVY